MGFGTGRRVLQDKARLPAVGRALETLLIGGEGQANRECILERQIAQLARRGLDQEGIATSNRASETGVWGPLARHQAANMCSAIFAWLRQPGTPPAKGSEICSRATGHSYVRPMGRGSSRKGSNLAAQPSVAPRTRTGTSTAALDRAQRRPREARVESSQEQHRATGGTIYENGNQRFWFLNDQLHREDGPAVEGTDGSREWYRHGVRHRQGGPGCRER